MRRSTIAGRADGTSERPGLANESVNHKAQEDQYTDQRDPPRCLWLESRMYRIVLHQRASIRDFKPTPQVTFPNAGPGDSP